jgi:hypothetical protein
VGTEVGSEQPLKRKHLVAQRARKLAKSRKLAVLVRRHKGKRDRRKLAPFVIPAETRLVAQPTEAMQIVETAMVKIENVGVQIALGISLAQLALLAKGTDAAELDVGDRKITLTRDELRALSVRQMTRTMSRMTNDILTQGKESE